MQPGTPLSLLFSMGSCGPLLLLLRKLHGSPRIAQVSLRKRKDAFCSQIPVGIESRSAYCHSPFFIDHAEFYSRTIVGCKDFCSFKRQDMDLEELLALLVLYRAKHIGVPAELAVHFL